MKTVKKKRKKTEKSFEQKNWKGKLEKNIKQINPEIKN